MAKTAKSKQRTPGKSDEAPPTARGSEGDNVSGYFRKLFKERPALIDVSSNQELLERWRADHPDEEEVPQRVKNILFNLKSILRKKRTEKRQARAAVRSRALAAAAPTPTVNSKGMEQLEEYIDECLTMAKNIDREGLEKVIGLLRRARNEVLWKEGH